MTTTTREDISNLIKDCWKNTSKSQRTVPTQWINDETPLNDTNLNTLTRCIDELQSLAAKNGEDAKEALGLLADYLDDHIISKINIVINNKDALQDAVNLSGTVTDISTTVTNISDTVTTLESTINSIKSDIGPMESEDGTIKSNIESIKSDIESIQSTIQSIQKNIASLQNADKKIQAEIDKINANIEALNNMIIVGTDDPNSTTDPELIESLKDAKYYIRYEEENEV